jgi:plasmid maintenance system antidote protein VapI
MLSNTKHEEGKQVKGLKKLKHIPYEQLKEELYRRKLSYRDLSRTLGISISSVCEKINGKSDFLISETLRLEAVYLIPRSAFLPGEFR